VNGGGADPAGGDAGVKLRRAAPARPGKELAVRSRGREVQRRAVFGPASKGPVATPNAREDSRVFFSFPNLYPFLD
jgi:hypothetical protein